MRLASHEKFDGEDPKQHPDAVDVLPGLAVGD